MLGCVIARRRGRTTSDSRCNGTTPSQQARLHTHRSLDHTCSFLWPLFAVVVVTETKFNPVYPAMSLESMNYKSFFISVRRRGECCILLSADQITLRFDP